MGGAAGGDGTWYGQVRGAIRRSPSPQQFFDSASKQVMGGLTAAGAALGSILEDDEAREGHASRSVSRRRGEESKGRDEREGFSDHERWSEEAEEKERVVGVVEEGSRDRADAARAQGKVAGEGGNKKKSVAIVVTADTNMDGTMDDKDTVYTEHAVRLPLTSPTPTSCTR